MADNQRSSGEEYRRGSILPLESAAAALAQLHNFRAEGPPPPMQMMSGWDSEQVRDPYFVFTAPPLFDSLDAAPAVAPAPVFTTLSAPQQQHLPTTTMSIAIGITANGRHGANGYSNGNGTVAVAASSDDEGDGVEGLIDNTFVHLQEPVYSDGEGGYRKSLSSRKNARFAPLLNDDADVFDEDQFIHPDLGGVGGQHQLKRELLPSSLARSPPGRSSTLPPGNRPVRPPRPRKRSVGQHAMKPKHERTKSRELQKRYSHDRKAYSAEPQAAAMGRSRWEDLIDAAASATEEDIREREDSRDRTPVRSYTFSDLTVIPPSGPKYPYLRSEALTLFPGPARLTSPLQPLINTALPQFRTLPVLHRQSARSRTHTPSADDRPRRSKRRPDPLPISRIQHRLFAILFSLPRIQRLRQQLPHTPRRPLRLLTHRHKPRRARRRGRRSQQQQQHQQQREQPPPPPRRDLLRPLQTAEPATRHVRVRLVYLRVVQRVRQCARGGSEEGECGEAWGWWGVSSV